MLAVRSHRHPRRRLALIAMATIVAAAAISLLFASNPDDGSPRGPDQPEAHARVTAAGAGSGRRVAMRSRAPAVTPGATRGGASVTPPALDNGQDDDRDGLGASAASDDEDRAHRVRHALIQRNIASLQTAVEEAQSAGLHERAALMRQRINHLQVILEEPDRY